MGSPSSTQNLVSLIINGLSTRKYYVSTERKGCYDCVHQEDGLDRDFSTNNDACAQFRCLILTWFIGIVFFSPFSTYEQTLSPLCYHHRHKSKENVQANILQLWESSYLWILVQLTLDHTYCTMITSSDNVILHTRVVVSNPPTQNVKRKLIFFLPFGLV